MMCSLSFMFLATRLYTIPLFCIALISSFFFHLFGVPLDLHSFPTRRSSDLAVTTTRRSSRTRCEACRAAAFHSSTLKRSEEHTSELQSRQYLVCRLLLEKKKFLLLPDLHVCVVRLRLRGLDSLQIVDVVILGSPDDV